MTSAAPPTPPSAFRVGVVGHRPDRLKNADPVKLAAAFRDVLHAVESGLKETTERRYDGLVFPMPSLLAVSPLAEGTDRIFADVALNLGWGLCCVMPFPRLEYEKDFEYENALEEDSLGRFRQILAEASTKERLICVELPGSRTHEAESYETGGSVVLERSDLLIAVWDGQRAHDKEGGTAGTIDAAIRSGIPVVMVDAAAPHAWRLAGTTRSEPHSVGAMVRAWFQKHNSPFLIEDKSTDRP